MFRCPTCIGVLADPTSRRCHMCGQRLRRRRPRVLGEEHRPGARLLPVERALHERLHGTSKPGGRRQYEPPPWAERYTASASVAAARMLADKAPTGSGSGVATLTAPPELRFDAYAAPVAPSTPVEDPPTLDMGALDIQAYLSSFEPAHDLIADPVEVEAAPEQFTAGREVVRDAAGTLEVSTGAPVQHEAQYELDTAPLDPEVQALVDDLYRKARAEIVGSFVGLDPDLAVETIGLEDDAAVLDEADELPPNTPRRRGWVPAVLADRRRHDGTGNGKRPNGNGWRRLD